jgi:ATPase subunit of ABC transporter with duplicated ATPase domains
MTALVTLDCISLSAPDGHRLFDGLSLALGRGRTGLVGRNGCGKSTLLSVIAGDIEPASGAVQRAGRIGVLAQIADERLTVAQALGVAAELARLNRMADGTGSLEDAAAADWTLEARVAEALAETGLASLALDRRLTGFSGGERTRIALARLLIEAPDVLLLDEPTNNLDTEGRKAVETLLDNWKGGVVIASHDRALLERVDRIVELSPVGATVFGGAWSAFAAARDAAQTRTETDLARAAQALKRSEREAQQARERQDRRDKAGRDKRAKGDAPKILLDARAERAEHTAAQGGRLKDRLIGDRASALDEARGQLEVLTPLAIDLPKSDLPAGRELLAVADLVMAFGSRRLFGPLSFGVRGPERITIRGRNGAGKTTLLRLITGDLSPTAGTVRRLTTRVAILDQHLSQLDPGASILDNLRRLNPEVSDHNARALLARFAFRNRAALQRTGTLSGGERMRAGLACIFAIPQPPELLLLDEPTNHLDLGAIEVLESALAAYDGALIAVSHDEAFLSAVGVTREITV